MVLPARDEPAKALQPGEEPLDLPAAAIATQRPAIPRHLPPVGMVRCDHLDPALVPEPLVQSVAVIGLAPDQALGSVLEKAGVDRLVDERDLR